jgi:hypothetical protein
MGRMKPVSFETATEILEDIIVWSVVVVVWWILLFGGKIQIVLKVPFWKTKDDEHERD